MKIAYVDRYGTYTDDYVHYVHYENGDIDQYGNYDNLPKEVKAFMGKADNFQFRKSKRGEFYHRFS